MYKIGDVFAARSKYSMFQEGKIVAMHPEGGYIVEVTVPSDDSKLLVGDLVRRDESALTDFYNKNYSFFQDGKTYRWKLSPSSATYRVLDVYLVDNPHPDLSKIYAVAIREIKGTQTIEILYEFDFPKMEKV